MTGFSSIAQMGLAVRGRWKLASVVTAVVFIAIIVIAALLPPRYTATAWVVFNSRGSDAVVDKNDSLGFAAYVNGEVDLIASRRVIARVAQDKAVLADPALYTRDPKRFANVNAELEKVRVDLAAAEERWLALAEVEAALAG